MIRQKSNSRNFIQELRPIKLELGGLTISNLFSKNNPISDMQDDDDDEDGDEHHSPHMKLVDQQSLNQNQDLDEDEQEIFQRKQVNFEPDPEDDNHIQSSNKPAEVASHRDIFEEESAQSSYDIKDHQQNALFQVIEDSRYTRFLYQKLQIIQVACSLFTILTIFLAIIQFDIETKQMNLDQQTKDYILLTISLGTLILMITIMYDYRVDLQLKKAQKIVTKNETLWSTYMAFFLIFEIIILVPHPNIVTRDNVVSFQETVEDITVTQHVNDFLGIWLLTRIYIIIRTILSHTIYSSTRATRICRMIGCDSGSFYSIKCIFREIPLTATTFLFLLSILIYGHALRVAEKQLFDLIPDNTQNFGNYLNCFWCIIITTTTVGYGDFYPKTLPGRIVIICAAITGVVLISILVVALNNTLNMNIAEKKTHHVIMRLQARKNLFDNAASVLTKAAKFKVMHDKNQIKNKSMQRDKLNTIKKELNNFRDLNRKIKNMYDNSNQSEEMYRQFEFLKSELKQIYENQNKLRDYLLKIKTNLNQNEFEDPSLFTENNLDKDN